MSKTFMSNLGQGMRKLQTEELDAVNGGCFGVPVLGPHGEVIYKSPTLDRWPGWPAPAQY